MIRANTRGRLTAADLQLVILLLSRGSAHRRAYLERRLATEGPDPLLDCSGSARASADGADDAGAVRSTVLLRRRAPRAQERRRRRPRPGRLSRGAAARVRPARPGLAGGLERRPAAPLPGGHPGRSRVEHGRAALPRHAPPRQLRALARRPVSRLYRGPTPPQRRAGGHLLRRAGPPRLRHGVRSCAGRPNTVSTRCSAPPPSAFPRFAARSTG